MSQVYLTKLNLPGGDKEMQRLRNRNSCDCDRSCRLYVVVEDMRTFTGKEFMCI